MVGSRNDTKQRRKYESPQDTQPKRTKVHAQRKFAQGAGGGLLLTPMKDKEKPRNNAPSAFSNNGANSNSSTNGPTTGTGPTSTANSNAPPASVATSDVASSPSCKRPSTEDFLTFLCFHRTNMLPNRLQFFSSAPQQELDDEGHPAQDSIRGSRSTERNREQSVNGGNRRSPLKAPVATHKAVTAAQALKKKYQDQRLKKTVASTLIQKGTQRLRTTRSGALIVPAVKKSFVAKTTPSRKEVTPAVNKKKVAVSSKTESTPKKSVKSNASTSSKPPQSGAPNSSSTRGGLRSGGLRSGGTHKLVSLRTQKSPQRKSLAKAVQSKVAKVVGKAQVKAIASSMSDFSSEDEQPLVKKNKPLMQARKLLKKSIASIGRKLMLEPRRTRRGVPLPTASPATRQKKTISVPTRKFRVPLRGTSHKAKDSQDNDDGVTGSSSETPRKKDEKAKSGKDGKDESTPKGKSKVDAKETRGSSPDSKRKSKANEKTGKRPPVPKMKKGYVLELVAMSDSEDTPEPSKLRRASRDLKTSAKTEKVVKKVASPEPMSRRSTGLVEDKKTPLVKKKTLAGKKEPEKKVEKIKTKKEEKKVKAKDEDDDSDEHKPLAKMTRRSQAKESSEEEEQSGRGKNDRGKKTKEEEEKPKGRWSNVKRTQKEATSEEEEDESEEDEKKVTRRSSGRLGGSKHLKKETRRSNLRSNEYSSDEDDEVLDKLRTRSKRSTHSQSSSEDEDEVERKSLRRSGRQTRNAPLHEESDESEAKLKTRRRSAKLISSDVETADENEKTKPKGRRSTKAASSDAESADESEKKPRGRRSTKAVSSDVETADESEKTKPRGRRSTKTVSSDESDAKPAATRASIRKGKKVSLSDEEESKKPKSKKAHEKDVKRGKEEIKRTKSNDSLNESVDGRPASPARKKSVSRSHSTIEKEEVKPEDTKKKKFEDKKPEVKEKADKGKKKKRSDDESVEEPVKSKLRKLTPRNHRVSDSGDSDDSVSSTPQRVLRERKSYFHFEEDEFSDLEDELLEQFKSPPPTKKEIPEAKPEKPAKETGSKVETKKVETADVAKRVKTPKEADPDKKKTATKEAAAKTQTKEVAKPERKKEAAAKDGDKKTERKKVVSKEKKAVENKQSKPAKKKVKSADIKSNEELATAFEKITLSKEEDTQENKETPNVPAVASFHKVPKPDTAEPIQVSAETEVMKDDLPSPLSTLAMAATSSLLNEKEEEEGKAQDKSSSIVSSEPISVAVTSAPFFVPAPPPITVPPPLTPYIPVSVPITTQETAMVSSRTVTSLPATSVAVSGSLPVFSPVTIRMATSTPSSMTSGTPISMNSLQSTVPFPGQVPVMLTIPTPPCVSTSVSTPMSAMSSMLVSTSATGSSSLIIPTSTTNTALGGLQGPATIAMSTSNQVTGIAPLLTSGMMQTQGATLASMQAATSITSSQLVFIKPPDKKDGTPVHGGMPDPTIAMSPVVLGMNPLLINNRNAGPTFFLSPAGQMVPGLSIPPVLSLRLPDKAGTPQPIFAGTQLYTVPIAIGNPVVSTGMVTATNQTVMKGARTAQFVLASKPGTVPNAPGNTSGGAPLILSVGEDGSHLLSEAPAGTHIMTQGTSTAIWKENQFVATDTSGLLSVIPTIKSSVPPSGLTSGSSSIISQGVATMGTNPSGPPINVTLPPTIIRPTTPSTQNITTVVSSTVSTPVSTPIVATVTPTLSAPVQVNTSVAVATTEPPKSTIKTVLPPASTSTIVSTPLSTPSTLTTATTTPLCATTSSSNVGSTSSKLSKKSRFDMTPSSSPTRSDTPPVKPKPKATPKSSSSTPAKTAITVSAAAALAAVSTVSKSYTASTMTVKSTNSLPSPKDNIVKCSSPVVTATVSSDKTPNAKPSKGDPPEVISPRAATHNTLLMLSTVIKKNDPTKEQKRELVVKKSTPETNLASKKAERKEMDLNAEKSGLASLAEVASTLAERVCTPPNTPDKSSTQEKCGKGTPRAPEHSFWTNPAHILGRETLKMPGLPLTSNLGVATKSELAKMKIGATLSDAVEVKSPAKKPEPVPEKKPKVEAKPEEPKPPSPVSSNNAASRVRKWLNENPPEEADKVEEPAPDDVSNLKSLADLCVSMERIADTSAEKKAEPQVKEPPKMEEKEVQAEEKPPITPPKVSTPSTTASTSLSMSPQTKIAWQTAFGVKSGPNKNVKTTPKKKSPGSPSTTNVLSKGPATICERWGNLKNIRIRQGGEIETEQPTAVSKGTETTPTRPPQASAPSTQREESQSSSSNDEISTVEKKSSSANRRSFLHRMNERKDPTPSANAFSVSNESSVYAFEADPELPPVSKPFRRRSKTSRSEEDLTRVSGEEDSSCASTSTSIAVQVNMDSVPAPARVPQPPSEPALKIIPVKETDSRGTEISTQTERTTTMDEEYSDSDSHTIYIPLASGSATGSSSTEGPQFQGLAVKVDTDGGPTHQRLIMKFQTQFVTKPVFKRPSTGSGSGSDEASAPKRPVLATQHPRPSAPLEPLTTTPPIGTVPPYTTRPRSGSTGLSDSPLKKSQDEDCDSKEDNGKTLRLETIAAGEEKVFAHPEQVDRKTDGAPGKSTDDADSFEDKEKALPESCSDSDTEKPKPILSEPSTSMAATLESRLQASSSRDSTPPPKSKATAAKVQAAKRRASQEPPVKQPKQRRTPKSKAFSSSQSTSCSSPPSPCPSTSSTSTIGPSRPSSVAGRRPSFTMAGTVLDAPVFHPTEKEFQDPLEYFEKIRPAAEKFGLCRIVPPSTFKPDCCVSDDMRFTAYNQYIHKTLHRWGPNTKELRAIKKYLATQSIQLKQVPLVGGMEVDLPRLYATVQNMGGLAEVIEKKRWFKVADAMRIPKSAQDRVAKLDDIYCKYLLPYDTLSSAERENLFDMVELEWSTREAKLNKQSSSSSVSSDEDDDSESESGDEMEECIVKGRSTSLSAFYRIARNTMSMWFKTPEPPAAEVETEFWKHVRDRNHHVCVHSGSIDSGNSYGFPVKNSSFAKHPWNLKVLTNNAGSVLRSLGPVMGVTVPTLHVGMLFTTCCWYKDPHSLPWIEYLHTGASKIWYGIPDSESALFREAVKDVAPQYVRDQTMWLASDTAMVPPPLLTEKEVTLARTVQAPGHFVLVFPRSYISSICTGYLVSESVYFAPPSWLDVAHQAFKDMQDSCEPAMFSLERLMFSVAEDSRSSVDVLNQILPVIMTVIENELSQRGALRKLGMDATERLPLDGKSKRKGQKVDLDDFECEVCRASLYVSMVSLSQEETVWCLPHALEQITDQRQIAKQCKLLYTYSQKELNELLQNLLDRIEDKTVSKPAVKPSGSKSRGSTSR